MMRSHLRRFLLLIYHFLVFFLLTSFIITSCVALFISTMQKSMDITFSAEDITSAAKITFVNVIILSVIFTAFDALRRKIMYERPVKRIVRAAERMIDGDFSVRLKRINSTGALDGFDEITDCFNKMAEELSGMETLRKDFISNVSHELKTPLAVIGNYATMLSNPDITPNEREEYARAISVATRKLSELVTNILRLNKLENQQIYPRADRYELGEQLCECLLSFESLWEEKNIEIETEIEDGIFVRTDAEMMTLVWNNLFSNAIKFTPNGGKVRLRLVADENYAIVSVSDTGCGISSEVGAKIFDKFYQVDASHSTSGNGLGLALVKKVMDVTSGEISVESQPDKGSVFTVRIRRDKSGSS